MMPMPPAFTAHSCAKINLSLDIVGVLPNGYHELRSVVHTIALCDTLRFSFDSSSASSTWRLSCDDASLCTEDNLCLRAARAWSQAARENGGPSVGGRIELEKRIPHGAGLGGGSGNAWAVLDVLRRLFDHDEKLVPHPKLLQIALGLGADVPLFASGGAMLMEGIGDEITLLVPLRGWVVLAQPRATVSTPASYRAWDEADVASANASAMLLEAMPDQESWSDLQLWQDDGMNDEARLKRVAQGLSNDLRVAARALEVPVEVGIEALQDAGALGAEMTGSGSAVFGLCRDEAHTGAVQAQATRTLEAASPGEWRLWSAPLCDYGVWVGSQ